MSPEQSSILIVPFLIAIGVWIMRRSWRAPGQGYLEVRNSRIDRADNPTVFMVAVYLNYAFGLAFIVLPLAAMAVTWLGGE